MSTHYIRMNILVTVFFVIIAFVLFSNILPDTCKNEHLVVTVNKNNMKYGNYNKCDNCFLGRECLSPYCRRKSWCIMNILHFCGVTRVEFQSGIIHHMYIYKII